MFYKHIAIMVRDLDKSVEFYETLAELKVLRRYQEGPAELAFLADKEGDTELELVNAPSMQKFEGKGFFLCFQTDRLDEMHQLAIAKGFNPSDIRTPDAKSRYFYAYDPDGVSVQLKQQL